MDNDSINNGRFLDETPKCDIPEDETDEKLEQAKNPFAPVFFTAEEAASLGAFEEHALTDEFGDELSDEELADTLDIDVDNTLVSNH